MPGWEKLVTQLLTLSARIKVIGDLANRFPNANNPFIPDDSIWLQDDARPHYYVYVTFSSF